MRVTIGTRTHTIGDHLLTDCLSVIPTATDLKWSDAATPRTDKPAAFLTTRVVNGWAIKQSHIAR